MRTYSQNQEERVAVAEIQNFWRIKHSELHQILLGSPEPVNRGDSSFYTKLQMSEFLDPLRPEVGWCWPSVDSLVVAASSPRDHNRLRTQTSFISERSKVSTESWSHASSRRPHETSDTEQMFDPVCCDERESSFVVKRSVSCIVSLNTNMDQKRSWTRWTSQ